MITLKNDFSLQGSDPGKYELIQKIQSLQKRLIAKTQELEDHELLLQVTLYRFWGSQTDHGYS